MLEDYIGIFDELKERDVYQYASYISASQYIKAFELVKWHFKNIESVLDWGLGNGHFSYFLLQEGFQVQGFTVEDQFILADFFGSAYPERFQFVLNPEAVSQLPYENESFDAVVSMAVLEHVRETGGNEIDSLTEIRRVLKPHGLFLCYHLPNKYSWIEAASRNLTSKYSHPYRFLKRDVREMLKQVGFREIESGTYGILPRLTFRKFPNSIFLTKLFDKLDRLLSALFFPFCQNHYFLAKRLE